MPSVIQAVPICQTVKPSCKSALSGDRVAALEAMMRRFAPEAKSRSASIDKAFRPGGSYEVHLDEVIRAAILPLVHGLFARPERRGDASTPKPLPRVNGPTRDADRDLSITFAAACRQADREHYARQSKQAPSKAHKDIGRVPSSTVDAINFLLKEKNEQRLVSFLEGRPNEELDRIERYIAWKLA